MIQVCAVCLFGLAISDPGRPRPFGYTGVPGDDPGNSAAVDEKLRTKSREGDRAEVAKAARVLRGGPSPAAPAAVVSRIDRARQRRERLAEPRRRSPQRRLLPSGCKGPPFSVRGTQSCRSVEPKPLGRFVRRSACRCASIPVSVDSCKRRFL